jgi:phenylalanine-4-hydroxylase
MSHPKTLLAPSHRHRAEEGALPPPEAAEDWTVPQHWSEFTAEDHWVWDTLFARQKNLLHGRAVREFEDGLDLLRMSRSGIPNFDELNETLERRTGWTVVAVPGLIPDETFLTHLAHRRFPAGNFIRSRQALDYLGEPDVFHDVFGHVPLLAHPAAAALMQQLGELGLAALSSGAIERFARLYWYTVEVGLAREEGDIRIYGAGIASSFGETHYSLESPRPHRLKFDLPRVLRTRYRPDDFQKSYFVIDRFDDLPDLVRAKDFLALCEELDRTPDVEPTNAEAGEPGNG